MRHLSVFSGIGGDSLGLKWAGMETVAFCENDKKCQLVLKKHWPEVPIFDDIRELTYEKLKEAGIVGNATGEGFPDRRGSSLAQQKQIKKSKRSGGNGKYENRTKKNFNSIDIISGGFPCQPFSVAGKRKGAADDRHLWPEYFRLIQEIGPRWVIGENVAGLINMGLDDVLSDLESQGYSCQTLVIPACAINAPHRRDRVWILAHSIHNPNRARGRKKAQENEIPDRGGQKGCTGLFSRTGVDPKDVADAEGFGIQRGGPFGEQEPQIQAGQAISGCHGAGSGGSHWTVEPGMGRVAHGVSGMVDRLKQLGNAIVPQVIEIIGRAIMEIEKE